MERKQEILLSIKSEIRKVVPDATVYLYGSRANNTEHEESDWDIFVLSDNPIVTKIVKEKLHDKIFPLSVSIGSFINLLVVSKKDWQENPSYYSLKKNVALNSQLL